MCLWSVTTGRSGTQTAAARDQLRLMEQQRARDRNVWLPTQAALQLSIRTRRRGAHHAARRRDSRNIAARHLGGVVAEWPCHRALSDRTPGGDDA